MPSQKHHGSDTKQLILYLHQSITCSHFSLQGPGMLFNNRNTSAEFLCGKGQWLQSGLGGPGWILGIHFLQERMQPWDRAPEQSQKCHVQGPSTHNQMKPQVTQYTTSNSPASSSRLDQRLPEVLCIQLHCASLKHSSCTGCISYRLREEESQSFMRKPVKKGILISQQANCLHHLPTLKLSFSSSAGSTSVCLNRQRLTAWIPKLRTGWVRRNSEMELK